MDEEVNGTKRPFGPHGEGCECEEEEEGEDEEAEPEFGFVESGVALTPDEQHYKRVVELSLGSMSSTLVEHFLNGLDIATESGNPLNRAQVIAMMSTLMTGYAEAKETASQIEYGLRILARQAQEVREQEEREAEAENKDNKLVDLHDISELFTPPSFPSIGNDG